MLRYKLQVEFKECPIGHSEVAQWGMTKRVPMIGGNMSSIT